MDRFNNIVSEVIKHVINCTKSLFGNEESKETFNSTVLPSGNSIEGDTLYTVNNYKKIPNTNAKLSQLEKMSEEEAICELFRDIGISEVLILNPKSYGLLTKKLRKLIEKKGSELDKNNITVRNSFVLIKRAFLKTVKISSNGKNVEFVYSTSDYDNGNFSDIINHEYIQFTEPNIVIGKTQKITTYSSSHEINTLDVNKAIEYDEFGKPIRFFSRKNGNWNGERVNTQEDRRISDNDVKHFSDILNDIDKNWSIKEKARKVYWEICKRIVYDERVAYGNNKSLLYELCNLDRDIDDDLVDENDYKYICKSANKIFLKLLKRLGIKAKLIFTKSNGENSKDSVALVFSDENGNKYYTCITEDIINCKYGLQTEFFGISRNNSDKSQGCKTIPEDELKEIDLKTKCIKTDYSNVLFNILIDEVKTPENFKSFLSSQGIDIKTLDSDDIVRYKMEYITSYVKLRENNVGPCEVKKFYERLMDLCVFDSSEKNGYETFEFIKDNGDNIDVVSYIKLISKKGFPIYYVFDYDEYTYKQIPSEELKKRIKDYEKFELRDVP